MSELRIYDENRPDHALEVLTRFELRDLVEFLGTLK